MEILLGFPFNLLWGALLVWFYRPVWQENLFLLFCALVLIMGLFLPANYFLSFWLPNGMSTMIVTFAFTLRFYYPQAAIEHLISIKLPSRNQLREAMLQVTSVEERQSLYLKIVKEYSNLWNHKEKILTHWNTQILLWVMVTSTVLGILVLAKDFFTGEIVINYLKQANELSQQLLPNKISEAEQYQTMSLVLSLAPAIYFVISSIFVLVYLSLGRLVMVRKIGTSVPVGQLVLFRLPDIFIWGFIAVGAALALSVTLGVKDIVFFVILNLMVMLSFLYSLNGLSIIQIFFEIRLLPGNWILLAIFLFSLFWLPLFLSLVGVILILGLGDFFFNFRKKALQPAILFENS